MIRIFDDTSIPAREMLLKGSDFLVKRDLRDQSGLIPGVKCKKVKTFAHKNTEKCQLESIEKYGFLCRLKPDAVIS